MLQQLRLLCRSEDCRHERIYMGHLVVQAKVETSANHKWNNVVFHNHTGGQARFWVALPRGGPLWHQDEWRDVHGKS